MSYAQDMPPKGGFGEINYKGVPTKRWVSNKKLALGCCFLLAYATVKDKQTRRNIAYDNVDEYDAKIALQPFFEAERDRSFLKMLRKNRELENKIMKDVPGWKLGTFYGVPYYKTLKLDSLIPESSGSFNIFSNDEHSRLASTDKLALSEWPGH